MKPAHCLAEVRGVESWIQPYLKLVTYSLSKIELTLVLRVCVLKLYFY